MKDIKTISKELGVTRQTVYRRLQKLDKQHTTTADGKMYVLESGLPLIGYEEQPHKKPRNAPETPLDDTDLVTQQERYIKTLEAQLEIKDKQIEALTELTDGLSQRLRENSFLLAQKQQLEIEAPKEDQSQDFNNPVTPPKATLLKRFKNLFKRES